jgi:hypothetical protein
MLLKRRSAGILLTTTIAASALVGCAGDGHDRQVVSAGAPIESSIAATTITSAQPADDPIVDPCATPGVDCAALRAPRDGFPPSQPPPDRPPIDQAHAEWVARQYAAYGALNPIAPATAEIHATVTAFGRLGELADFGFDDPSIARDRAVWVVTVHAPIRMGTEPAELTHDVYTVVLDVASGFQVALCGGIDAFVR